MKKICVTITTRGNHGKLKSVMDCIEENPELELQVIYGGEALIKKYCDIRNGDGKKIYYLIEGENPITMAKSAGLALTEFTSAFNDLRPDIVVVVGDRFDTLSIVMAASYMNIPVAHIEGGEVSGSIDNKIRYAVSMMSDIHFPATSKAAEMLWSIGCDNVHNVGSTSIDAIIGLGKELRDIGSINEYQKVSGVGTDIDFNEPYIVVLFHPVTTEYEEAYRQTEQLCRVIHMLDLQVVWIWPHSDAGSDGVSKAIREYREGGFPNRVKWFRGLPLELYAPLINNCKCLVGNSSSGIRESSVLGIPVVNIGSRQDGRERGGNVLDVDHHSSNIIDAIIFQCKNTFEANFTYGQGNSGKKIVEILKEAI